MAKKMSFEDAFGRLNEIVKNLEEGDVPLEESMKLYEEGMRLGGLCRSILSEAEERIRRIASQGVDQSGKGDE